MTIGLRERALAEHEEALARQAARDGQLHDYDMAQKRQHTEELLRSVLGLSLDAPSGQVTADQLTLGARFVRVNGHSAWRLCLIETCVLCLQALVTPFSSRAGLGAILAARRDGTRATHPVAADCWRQRRIEFCHEQSPAYGDMDSGEPWECQLATGHAGAHNFDRRVP